MNNCLQYEKYLDADVVFLQLEVGITLVCIQYLTKHSLYVFAHEYGEMLIQKKKTSLLT